MEVVKILPRGYCHGVITAMHKVSEAISDDSLAQPIYILGQIVHNKNITKAFSEKGVITLSGGSREELLKQVDQGTVIITAHGIDYHLIKKAKDKGLTVIDATCSDVYKTHDIIKDKLNDGYEVIYIGKKNHPEPEGVLGINKEKIHLVENTTDIDNLNISSEKICITNQTTMSTWDVDDLIKYSKTKYPNLEVIKEICNATQERQEAVVNQAKDCDLCLVVGDVASNNSKRLVDVCQNKAKTKAKLIADVNDIDINWLLDPSVKKVGVTSGASTPSILTNQVIEYINQFEKDDEETHIKPELPAFSRMIPRSKKPAK